ncbi:MAG TPA: hypothetical protein VLB44_01645 [Kofleriaceae bacterium]|nr:hypothetical protein [Kofleriaceae bacterium]
MKKIAIVLFVVAAALAGCGKKKAPAAPAGGDTAGSAVPAEAGSGSTEGGAAGSAAPAEGGGGGGM